MGRTLGVSTETAAGETRVAATPATVRQLAALGYEVLVESGAVAAASFTDEVYAQAGARIADRGEAWTTDVVIKVNPPTDPEIGALRDGATLIGMIGPALRPELVQTLGERPITVL